MKAALIYFSGTGNTEYVMKKFQEEFKSRGIASDLINTSEKETLKNVYDFYVFGAPIHAEMFPKCYIQWVKENIQNGINKKCIIVSTQASTKGVGAEELYNILTDKGMKTAVKDFIQMPNNYYIVMFKKSSDEEVQTLKKYASDKVKMLVNNFVDGDTSIKKISKSRLVFGKISYSLFYKYSLKWALKNLSVDKNTCIKCGKCVQECPVGNINLVDDKITFNKKCISCQHCIHMCPVNAFKYKGDSIEQYKI